MRITGIKPRKDGKFLVGLHFNHGTNLRKIMTRDELDGIYAKIEAEKQQEREYLQQAANVT